MSAVHQPSRKNQWPDVSKRVARMDSNPLTVAGAATVLVPFRVVLTVFPINPLGVIARGTVGDLVAPLIEDGQGVGDFYATTACGTVVHA
jgi:hypothetical protein